MIISFWHCPHGLEFQPWEICACSVEQVGQDLAWKIVHPKEEGIDAVGEPVRAVCRRLILSERRITGSDWKTCDLRSRMTEEEIRLLKGLSSWLTTLSLAKKGYVLSKREFFGAIYLRYRS